MQTIAHIHRDATITWDEVADPDQRLLEECGDVILNLLDVWDPSQFLIDNILERWADGWNFSLAGIAVLDAVTKMHATFVFPTTTDLVPEYAEAVEALRGAELNDEQLDGELGDLLNFPVRVNGALLRVFLCDIFDGPFWDEEANVGAIMLHSVA